MNIVQKELLKPRRRYKPKPWPEWRIDQTLMVYYCWVYVVADYLFHFGRDRRWRKGLEWLACVLVGVFYSRYVHIAYCGIGIYFHIPVRLDWPVTSAIVGVLGAGLSLYHYEREGRFKAVTKNWRRKTHKGLQVFREKLLVLVFVMDCYSIHWYYYS